jgi:hypothetical protein
VEHKEFLKSERLKDLQCPRQSREEFQPDSVVHRFGLNCSTTSRPNLGAIPAVEAAHKAPASGHSLDYLWAFIQEVLPRTHQFG